MWDPVPWFVGGGAEHSPEVARLLTFAATGGAEGIVTPGDLKVATTAVPSSSIRVLAGSALINSKAAGGAQQTYAGRNVSEDVKAIGATGSGSGRSDLIVARVEDPYMAGEPWADPVNPAVGPYIFTRVIPNVAAGTTLAPAGSSAIPLARIDIPANTGTITAGMIKDLRYLARPRSLSRSYGGAYPADTWYYPGNKEPGDLYDMVILSAIRPTVNIPAWATHVDISANLTSVLTQQAVTMGAIRVKLGDLDGPLTNYDTTDGGIGLVPLSTNIIGAAVPANMRGTTQALTFRARIDLGPIAVVKWSTLTFQVSFYENAV